MTGTETRSAAGQSDLPGIAARPTPGHRVAPLASIKVQPRHLERMAIVYVRQSTERQVRDNRESGELQYALADYAASLGWPRERVSLTDDDQARSATTADGRDGFQRLLAEVTMDHVGIVVGMDMSRLARCDKDWHHLLEVCGIFGTLVADQDGVYDVSDPNDRLLLGLKGMISSVELQTMRNRMGKALLNKAERGELFHRVPAGYVKLPSGGVALDPDEQARSVVGLIFAKFVELGSASRVFDYLLEHGIRIGVRAHEGPNRGQLEWRRPSRATLYSILRNPMYAGTYAYGRCQVDRKRQHLRGAQRGRRWVPMEEWKVVRHGQVPAYIGWDQYLANQERLRRNRSHFDEPGTPRQGSALLAGVVFCARCGTRMQAYYATRSTQPRYDCVYHLRHGLKRACHGVRASALDALVTRQVLRALEPAALELSLRAGDDIQRERDRLGQHWQQRVERGRYEAQAAERRYRAVDPENRLVARTLEREWEQALAQERQTQEEYDRFRRRSPQLLTDDDRERIRALAADIPALWASPETSESDRKEVIRCLVERVAVAVQDDTEVVNVTIHWVGGPASQHQVCRPIADYKRLRDYDRLRERLRDLRRDGLSSGRIADQLNREGFRCARPGVKFSGSKVRLLLSRWGLAGPRAEQVTLGADEWWLRDLASAVGVNPSALRRWASRGWVHWRRPPAVVGWRILWADAEEVERLKRLRDYGKAHRYANYPPALTAPKERPAPGGPAAES